MPPSHPADLPPFGADGRVQAVIDTPKGSRAKYKLEGEGGFLRLSKLLPRGVVFPGNFGFIPGTRGEDGDALDILVLGDEPLFPGCVLSVRVLGALRAMQTDVDGACARNDRLIGGIDNAFNPAELEEIEQAHPIVLNEITRFFVSYNQAQGRIFQPEGYVGAPDALNLIKDAAVRP